MSDQHALRQLADRIEADEDFAMKVGEDARTALESEGVEDRHIAEVLSRAEVDVVGFALPHDAVASMVERISGALRSVAEE